MKSTHVHMQFCGTEIKQGGYFNITVTCIHSTEQITPIKYKKDERRKMIELATDAEIGQMRSVIGSLGWIACQCWPDLS